MAILEYLKIDESLKNYIDIIEYYVDYRSGNTIKKFFEENKDINKDELMSEYICSIGTQVDKF